VPASSLIFVVIVAIWAVYLLQHWSRRRENAAAARSVDGFTEAMRVLEKRRILPSAELAEPRPHSYSVTPARVVRTTVDVKRAVPAGASRRASPLVARRRSDITHAEVETMSPATSRAHSPQPRPSASRVATPHASRPDSRRPPSPAPAPVSRVQRRLRGALLLISLLWVPTSIVLAVMGILLWASVPLSVLTVAAVLVWLRTEAQADRARAAGAGVRDRRRPAAEPLPVLTSDDTQVIREPHRYAAATVAKHGAGTAASAAAVATAGPQPAASRTSAHDAASAALVEPATAEGVVAAQASSAAYDTVFDVQAAEPTPSAMAQPTVEAAPGTWSPVPVPRPTYAMKAKAEPRYTADGIPADVFETPEFAEEAEELDDRALFARRAASQ
jgi:hypothetical protein